MRPINNAINPKNNSTMLKICIYAYVWLIRLIPHMKGVPRQATEIESFLLYYDILGINDACTMW